MDSGEKFLSVLGTTASIAVGIAVGVGLALLAVFTFGLGTVAAAVVIGALAVSGGVFFALTSPISIFEEVLFGGNPEYGTGLISIYKEADDTIGKRGDYLKHDGGSKEQEIDVVMDMENKEMTIVSKGMSSGFKYQIDGWSGRYGLPLEFLLGLHLATMAPDLPMAMASYFHTDVEILLRKLEGNVYGGYSPAKYDNDIPIAAKENQIITLAEMMEALGMDPDKIVGDSRGFWQGIGDWFVGNTKYTDIGGDKYADLFNIDKDGVRMPHSSTCTCEFNDEKDVIYNKDDNPTESPCSDCKREVYNLVTGIKEINGEGKEEKWNGYMPYINQVTDHWFRNVYFTSQADQFGKNSKNEGDDTFIVVDKEYEMRTDERWSLFQVYVSEDEYDTRYAKANDEEKEIIEKAYKKINSDARTAYATMTEEELIEFLEREYVLVYLSSGKYTNEEGTEIPYVEGKEFFPNTEHAMDIGRSDYAKELGIPVTKVVVTNTSNEVKGIWNSNTKSAYELIEGDQTQFGTWEQYIVKEDDSEELQQFADNPVLYYRLDIKKGEMKQVEDGVRGQTNPAIKEMFLEDIYFKFDGSVDKADQIIALKKFIGYDIDTTGWPKTSDNKGELKIKRQQAKKDRQDMLKTVKDNNYVFTKGVDGDNNEIITASKHVEGQSIAENQVLVKGSDLVGKVNLSKDSLTAFSILENTHTLDAEYVYRDFKELIVELDYFDKEDLTTTGRNVMEWVLPQVGSAGWPIRRWDKLEDQYGTLIRSKEAYKIKKEQLKRDLEEFEPTGDSSDEELVEISKSNSDLNVVSRVEIASLGTNLPEFNLQSTANTTSIGSKLVDDVESKIRQISVDQFLETANKVHEAIERTRR